MTTTIRIVKSTLIIGMASVGILLLINLLRASWLRAAFDLLFIVLMAGLYVLVQRVPRLARFVVIVMAAVIAIAPLAGAVFLEDVRAMMSMLALCAVILVGLISPPASLIVIVVEAVVFAWFALVLHIVSAYVPGILVAVSVIIYLIVRSLNESLAQAEAAQRNLSERNDQLEQALRELTVSLERQQQLLDTVRALQTPLIESEYGEGVLVVVGFCDAQRITDIQQQLFSRLQHRAIRRLIIDVSGAQFEQSGLERLADLLDALRLIVSEVLVSGMSVEQARKLAQDREMATRLHRSVRFVHTLQDALVPKS